MLSNNKKNLITPEASVRGCLLRDDSRAIERLFPRLPDLSSPRWAPGQRVNLRDQVRVRCYGSPNIPEAITSSRSDDDQDDTAREDGEARVFRAVPVFHLLAKRTTGARLVPTKLVPQTCHLADLRLVSSRLF